MNKRIKELLEQAGMEDYPIQGVNTLYGDKVIQKFAELIVRECYAHCAGQLMDKPLAEAHGLTYNDGVMDCAIGLLQHFGVEE